MRLDALQAVPDTAHVKHVLVRPGLDLRAPDLGLKPVEHLGAIRKKPHEHPYALDPLLCVLDLLLGLFGAEVTSP